jgi:hypothetical protein
MSLQDNIVSAEIKNILDLLSIPQVIINIIDEYWNKSFILLTQLRLPDNDMSVIDDDIYICILDAKKQYRFYVKVFDTNNYNVNYLESMRNLNMTSIITSANEYVMSFKYKLTIRGVKYNKESNDFDDIPGQNCTLHIENKNINLLSSKLSSTYHIRGIDTYEYKMYFTTGQYDAYSDVFRLNLRTLECNFFGKLPRGAIHVTKNFICINDYNNILHIYDKDAHKIKNIKHNIYDIMYMTDQYIYGKNRKDSVVIQSIQSHKIIHKITNIKYVHFGNNIFFVSHRNLDESNDILISIYKIRF